MKISIKFGYGHPIEWHEITEECPAQYPFVADITAEQWEHFSANYNYLDYSLQNGVLTYNAENNGYEKLLAWNENQMKMSVLKQSLVAMDYKTSKYADGEYTQEEWTTIVAQRKAIRAQIRQLGG